MKQNTKRRSISPRGRLKIAEKMADSSERSDKASALLTEASTPTNPLATKRMTAPRTPQINSWVMPTRAMPMILPIISWKGRTLDTIISIMRFVFSSITPCITIAPQVRMKMQMMKVKIEPANLATSVEDAVVSPLSFHFAVEMFTLLPISLTMFSKPSMSQRAIFCSRTALSKRWLT